MRQFISRHSTGILQEIMTLTHDDGGYKDKELETAKVELEDIIGPGHDLIEA